MVHKDLVKRVGNVYKLFDYECDLKERSNTTYNFKTHVITLFLLEKLDGLIELATVGNGSFDFDQQDEILRENMWRCAERIKRMLKAEALEEYKAHSGISLFEKQRLKSKNFLMSKFLV